MDPCPYAIENSQCEGGICRCLPGYRPTPSGGSPCTPRRLNDTCVGGGDCAALINGYCVNGTCQCLPAFVPKSGTDLVCLRGKLMLRHKYCS